MRAAPMAHVQSPWTARHVRERATWSVSAPRPPWMVTRTGVARLVTRGSTVSASARLEMNRRDSLREVACSEA